MRIEGETPPTRTTLRARLVVGAYAVLGSMTASALALLGTNEWGELSPLKELLTVGLFLAVVGGCVLSVFGPLLARLLARESAWRSAVRVIALCAAPLGLLAVLRWLQSPNRTDWAGHAALALLVGGTSSGILAADRLSRPTWRPYPILARTLPLVLAACVGLWCRIGVEARPFPQLFERSPVGPAVPSPDGTRNARVYRSELLHDMWRTMFDSPLTICWTLEVRDSSGVRRSVYIEDVDVESLESFRSVRYSLAWDASGELISVQGGPHSRSLTAFDTGEGLVVCEKVVKASGTLQPLPAQLAVRLHEIGRTDEEVSRLSLLVLDKPAWPAGSFPHTIVSDDPNVVIEVPSGGTWPYSIVARGPVHVRLLADRWDSSTIASRAWILLNDVDRSRGEYIAPAIFAPSAPSYGSYRGNRPVTVVPPTK